MPKDPKTGKRLRDKDGNVIPYANESPEEAQQAAVSEESMVDKVEDTLAVIQEPEMVPDQPDVESPEADEGLLMQLFKVVYREDFVGACDFCNGRSYSMPNIVPAIQVRKPLEYVKLRRMNEK